MNIWNNLPFVRLLIAFLTGLLLAINFPEIPDVHFFFFAIPLIAYVILQRVFKLNYKLRFIKGFPIVLFFILFGIKLVKLQTELNFSNHYSKHVKDYYLVKLIEPPKIKANTLKLIGEVIAVKQQQSWVKTKGKILIYLAKDKSSEKLTYGDILLSNAKITETPAPKNPFEFNYKKYLAFHQIHHQSYLNTNHWINTHQCDANPILKYSFELRNYLLQLISLHGIQGDEYAIGSALILGYEDDLSNEVIGSFAATGALHVLSVSGLHVGIVFLVLNFLLQYLGDSKPARITRFIVSLAGLWFYALITGLSPSVWRAAAMFSLITIGKFYKKDLNTFNIIGCSAFVLLCFNPFMITEVGFQLSYLAVIGIVTLHQKFYELLSFKNKIVNAIWSITCVSVAAQLVTFPLGLLYFHQFPNYFLFSNLVVIPLSTIILYGGIALLALAKIPVAGAFVAKFLNILLWLLKSSVALFENLPYAVFEGIAIGTLDTFIIYGILIGLYCYWLYRKLSYVNISLTLSLVFCSLQIAEKIEQKKQHKIVVYAINKHFAIDFIYGHQNELIADSALIHNKDKTRFHILPNWNNSGLANTSKLVYTNAFQFKNEHLTADGNYLFYKNKTILCTANNNVVFKKLLYKPEIVLLNKRNQAEFTHLFTLFPEAKFICDGTVSVYQFRHLKTKNPTIDMRSVMNEGAITIDVL